jgi:hypothetical protein
MGRLTHKQSRRRRTSRPTSGQGRFTMRAVGQGALIVGEASSEGEVSPCGGHEHVRTTGGPLC